jgi:acetylornithine deacetylase/succinyl-diaminopimelate desuccinylase-like protein
MSAALDPEKLLMDYVRFPSVSTDPAFKAGLDGAREFACGVLAGLGFKVEVVPTALHPIILAERGGDPKWPHVIIYGHYDVQPPDPLDKWTTPAFEPVVRGRRLYARGAADNKGPQAVQFGALARVLGENPDLPLRITFLIEGEEEIGSPSFPEFLKKYRDRLREANLVILSDTGSPGPEQIVITTGLRGLTGLEVTVTGPRTDLHSGIHGGALLNPIQAVCELCAGLHAPDGRVNIPGFYDDVREPAQWERDELAKYPRTLENYKEFLGVTNFYTAPGYSALEAVRFGPTLDFNGIGGGYQGEGSKTVIPSKAFAKITMRLVPDQKAEVIRDLLEKTLRHRCPSGVTLEFGVKEGGSPYAVVPPGRPNTPGEQSPVLARAFAAADAAITECFGKKPLYLREGGSVPIIGQIKQSTGLDSLMIGLFTPEDNLHAPDESFSLDILEKGVATYAKLLKGLAAG